jgi:hypothetical protein
MAPVYAFGNGKQQRAKVIHSFAQVLRVSLFTFRGGGHIFIDENGDGQNQKSRNETSGAPEPMCTSRLKVRAQEVTAVRLSPKLPRPRGGQGAERTPRAPRNFIDRGAEGFRCGNSVAAARSSTLLIVRPCTTLWKVDSPRCRHQCLGVRPDMELRSNFSPIEINVGAPALRQHHHCSAAAQPIVFLVVGVVSRSQSRESA